MSNLSSKINANVLFTINKLNVKLCDVGRKFLSTDNKSDEELLKYYIQDFSFNCRYPIINGEFMSQHNNPNLLHKYGIYINEDVTNSDAKQITLLGTSKATLTINSGKKIAVKDNSELILYPEAPAVIYLFDNAKCSIEEGPEHVIVKKFSNNVSVTYNTKQYTEYNHA